MSVALVPAGRRELVELVDLADRAREYATDSKSAATRRAYAADLRCFEGWCARHGVLPYPLAPAPAAMYLAFLAENKALATITRRRAAITVAHRDRGFDESPFAHRAVREVWNGIRRSLGAVPQNARTALLMEDLRRVVAPLGTGLRDLRDRALLLVGFAGAFRRSEVVGLDVADVRFVAAGLEVTLRRSKTDQEGAGRLVGIPYGSRLETCPVRSLRAWLDAAGIDAGPLFRGVCGQRASSERLTPASVALVVKRRAKAAELDSSRLAGHSLRAGFATSAAFAGVSESLIAQQTGHRSLAILRRYVRPATVWQNNAAASVGL
jgi:integrase